MKKLFFPLIVMCLCLQVSYAGPVDENAARQTAIRFMNAKVNDTRGTLSNAQLATVHTGFSHLYIFNVQGGGFVIVSDDDRTIPVLAYSPDGFIDTADMAPAFADYLDHYNVQLQQIAEGATALPYVMKRNLRNVTPLIQTHWKQSSANGTCYNSMLPYDTSITTHGHRPVVGCQAAAMGQVAKFWQWPVHGYGSNSYSFNYNCWNFGTISVNFDSAYYDWTNMPAMLTDTSTQVQKDAVGELLYHCGVSVNMMYNNNCSGSSSSYFRDNYAAMINHFSYGMDARLCSKKHFTDDVWLTMIKNDLDRQLPILTRGQSIRDDAAGTLAGGHAYVFDGYDENDYVHVNWGWGGSYDGYFNILALTPYTQRNYSHSEQAIFNLHPDYEHCRKYIDLSHALQMPTGKVQKGTNIQGNAPVMNLNDTAIAPFVGIALFTRADHQFVRWLDVKRLPIPANDTVQYTFNTLIDDPAGYYNAQLFYSFDTLDVNATTLMDAGNFVDKSNWYDYRNFTIVDTNRSSLSNLVIFIRFADDEEITHPFANIDSMFNCKAPGYQSVYNYYDVSTYGRLHYNTLYADQIIGDSIISFVDAHPRGYYQPYSETNPIGYHGANPLIGISMREAELLAAAMDYVDSMELVNDYVMLDCDNDGYIDNLSFIVKGGTGAWASLLWPHMEFFPQDSIAHTVYINEKRPRTFNFEFEGGGSSLFNANVFRHEMAHSLGVPDMYHYEHFNGVNIAGSWDMMGNNYVMNQTCIMNKIKYLRVADEPIEITEDGTYTLYSNATSPTQSCYIIKSAIDPNQWFTFEYRNTNDPFDEGIPGSGLIAGRWNNNVPQEIYANAFFDNDSILHQYWIFRPGSSNDTVDGDLYSAHFSAASGRTSFGPATDPHPYLADATPETSFEITEIQEFGEYLTFHVHFNNVGIETPTHPDNIAIYPNPATQNITITGDDIQRVEIYNTLGQKLLSESIADPAQTTLSVSDLTNGVYLARVICADGSANVIKFVKQ